MNLYGARCLLIPVPQHGEEDNFDTLRNGITKLASGKAVNKTTASGWDEGLTPAKNGACQTALSGIGIPWYTSGKQVGQTVHGNGGWGRDGE